jgi:hypothetical protein
MKKQILSEEFSRMQKLAGIEFIGVDPITESNIIDQDFKVLKNQQDILKKVSNFYREKAEELKIDRKLIGDFNAAINALEDAIFKANYDK